jgi:ferrous iron transport protein B
LIATIIIWLLQSFDIHFNMVADKGDSILAMVAGWISPIMKPVGLGDWRICVSLISGFMAKESVVATMQILFGAGLTAVLTKLTAASMLVFSLLYTPCVAAVASIRRELGSKWAVVVVLWQCAVAWAASFVVILIGTAIGM